MLKITRGDTKGYKFYRKSVNGEIIKWLPDEMYLTLKKDFNDKEYVFQKKLTTKEIRYNEDTGCYSFQLDSVDTQSLDYGVYVLDISFKVNGVVKTIYIDELEITNEVTFYNNM